jgi:hypothetical protein
MGQQRRKQVLPQRRRGGTPRGDRGTLSGTTAPGPAHHGGSYPELANVEVAAANGIGCRRLSSAPLSSRLEARAARWLRHWSATPAKPDHAPISAQRFGRLAGDQPASPLQHRPGRVLAHGAVLHDSPPRRRCSPRHGKPARRGPGPASPAVAAFVTVGAIAGFAFGPDPARGPRRSPVPTALSPQAAPAQQPAAAKDGALTCRGKPEFVFGSG